MIFTGLDIGTIHQEDHIFSVWGDESVVICSGCPENITLLSIFGNDANNHQMMPILSSKYPK